MGCLTIVAAALTLGAFNAWLVMLGFGVLHSYVPQVPAIGFLPAWLVLVIFGILTGRGGVQVKR